MCSEMTSMSSGLIDASIALIKHKRAKILAQARKNRGCMHTSFGAQVSICAKNVWIVPLIS